MLIAIALLFVHAFYALGAFAWQAWQRHRGQPGGFELAAARARNPALSLIDLEALATKRLEFARIATRVAPMLGLVATMIPMGNYTEGNWENAWDITKLYIPHRKESA